MGIRRHLFPAESRYFPGQRWANITLRTLHLVGIAGLGGGFFYPAVGDEWHNYLLLTLVTGVGLSLISIYSNGVWLVQLRGLVVLAKLLLLGLIEVWPEAKLVLIVVVIVISGYIAHAPARVRYYSLWHRRRIESL